MYQAGLVLEGGGMKGVYTAGVLDLFLDKNLGSIVLVLSHRLSHLLLPGIQ